MPDKPAYVPCVWGSRRDDYRWGGVTGDRQDVAAFRLAASAAAAVLHYHYRSDAWAGLLPGTISDVLGTRSDLYLADYWALVLHHMIWTGRLPYPAEAEWPVGDGIERGPYLFVSRLSTDLTEASREALILFEEVAVAGPGTSGPAGRETPSGLSIQRHGRWELAVPGRPIVPSTRATEPAADRGSADPAMTAAVPVPAPAALGPELDVRPTGVRHDASEGGDEPGSPEPGLKLDDQAFTVRYGAGWYRFPPRSKLLFALLERVARRPGTRVDFDDLRTIGDVWDGLPVEDSTVRGAVARLRGVLEENDMADLAVRIQTGTFRGRGYVLLGASGEPDHDEWRAQRRRRHTDLERTSNPGRSESHAGRAPGSLKLSGDPCPV